MHGRDLRTRIVPHRRRMSSSLLWTTRGDLIGSVRSDLRCSRRSWAGVVALVSLVGLVAGAGTATAQRTADDTERRAAAVACAGAGADGGDGFACVGPAAPVADPGAPGDPAAPAPCLPLHPAAGERCEAWTAEYDYAPGRAYDGFDLVTDMAVDRTGTRAFVTGWSRAGDGTVDWATVAFDQRTGTRLWSARHHGAGDAADVPLGVAVSPGGDRVAVAGALDVGWAAWSPSQGYLPLSEDGAAAVVVYDATTGDPVWDVRADEPASGADAATALAFGPLGQRLYTAGLTTRSGHGNDVRTTAFEAADGTELWQATLDIAGAADEPSGIAVAHDGTAVFVTGFGATAEGGTSAITAAYETGPSSAPAGTVRWTATEVGQSPLFPPSLALAPDGSRVFVAGTEAGGGYRTAAYDTADGTRHWFQEYAGPGAGHHAPQAIAADPGGARVYVTGFSAGTSDARDFATLAYAADNGRQLWEQRYNFTSLDGARSVAVGPDGRRVYVGGYSEGCQLGCTQAATIAYDSTSGQRSWLARYDGLRESHGIAVGVGPGHVLTAAQLCCGPDPDGTEDFGLFAYRVP